MSARKRAMHRRGTGMPVPPEPNRPVERFTADVRLFAWVAELAEACVITLDLPRGVRASTVIARALKAAGLDENYGPTDSLRLAVNQEYANPSLVVEPGDELALIPPISGGAPAYVRVTGDRLDLQRMHDLVTTDGSGAIVTFSGITRDIELVHYEAYEEMAQRRIEQIVAELLQTYLLDVVAVEHRVGKVPLNDPAVIVAVSARERPAAFAAAREAIDRVLSEAPIWRLELDSGYRSWIRGEHPDTSKSHL